MRHSSRSNCVMRCPGGLLPGRHERPTPVSDKRLDRMLPFLSAQEGIEIRDRCDAMLKSAENEPKMLIARVQEDGLMLRRPPKKMLLGLRENTQKYAGPFDLPEPDDHLRGAIRKIVEHEIEHVPKRR